MALDQKSVRNTLLSHLAEPDFAALAADFELVDLKVRQLIATENKPISHVYFPESGLCSVLPVGDHRDLIEGGLFGCEGMSDVAFDQTYRSPTRVMVQAPGQAWRLPVKLVSEVSRNSPAFLLLLLKYQQTVTAQTAYTCLSHGSFHIDERLARWLLMCQDRLGDLIPLVHEFFALMLAVRRSGVTDAIHSLEGQQLIRARRGRITILDRSGLVLAAQGSYGAPEAHYQRLIGTFGRP